MKLIVGLGNPGEKYENTRHNIGFVALDHLLQKFEPMEKTFWDDERKMKTLLKKIDIHGEQVLLIKPQTYMNDSGIAVSSVVSYYKIDPQDITVIYDELDLPIGKIRVRFGGGYAGHRGMESVVTHLNTDKFLRIRLGIGHPHRHEGKEGVGKSHLAVEDYVVSNFTSTDKGKVKSMTKEVVRIIENILKHGIDTYMSKYNKA